MNTKHVRLSANPAEHDGQFISVMHMAHKEGKGFQDKTVEFNNTPDLVEKVTAYHKQLKSDFPTQGHAIFVHFPRGVKRPKGWKQLPMADHLYYFPDHKAPKT